MADDAKADKEPFVGQGDRPEVRLDPDTPVSELRVRDLSDILNRAAGKHPHFEVGKTSLKDFFDKPFPEVVKDWLKESKIEKVEKSEKMEKNEKVEKVEKREKNEKIELEPPYKVFDLDDLVLEPDPLPWRHVVESVAGLRERISQLSDQVAELQKRAQG